MCTTYTAQAVSREGKKLLTWLAIAKTRLSAMEAMVSCFLPFLYKKKYLGKKNFLQAPDGDFFRPQMVFLWISGCEVFRAGVEVFFSSGVGNVKVRCWK